MLLKPAKIARVLTILSVIGLFPALASAQTNDPLVGTWNFKVTATGGCSTNCEYMGMIAFNQGGTAVGSPGHAPQGWPRNRRELPISSHTRRTCGAQKLRPTDS